MVYYGIIKFSYRGEHLRAHPIAVLMVTNKEIYHRQPRISRNVSAMVGDMS
jgi:hypothetical protein